MIKIQRNFDLKVGDWTLCRAQCSFRYTPRFIQFWMARNEDTTKVELEFRIQTLELFDLAPIDIPKATLEIVRNTLLADREKERESLKKQLLRELSGETSTGNGALSIL